MLWRHQAFSPQTHFMPQVCILNTPTCFLLSGLFWIPHAVRCHIVYSCRVWIIFEEMYSIFMCQHEYIFSLSLKRKNNKIKQAHYLCVYVSVPFQVCSYKNAAGVLHWGDPLGPPIYSASADRLHCQLVRKIPLLSLFFPLLSTKSKVRAVGEESTGWLKLIF